MSISVCHRSNEKISDSNPAQDMDACTRFAVPSCDTIELILQNKESYGLSYAFRELLRNRKRNIETDYSVKEITNPEF
jgi:hypothetical protein